MPFTDASTVLLKNARDVPPDEEDSGATDIVPGYAPGRSAGSRSAAGSPSHPRCSGSPHTPSTTLRAPASASPVEEISRLDDVSNGLRRKVRVTCKRDGPDVPDVGHPSLHRGGRAGARRALTSRGSSPLGGRPGGADRPRHARPVPESPPIEPSDTGRSSASARERSGRRCAGGQRLLAQRDEVVRAAEPASRAAAPATPSGVHSRRTPPPRGHPRSLRPCRCRSGADGADEGVLEARAPLDRRVGGLERRHDPAVRVREVTGSEVLGASRCGRPRCAACRGRAGRGGHDVELAREDRLPDRHAPEHASVTRVRLVVREVADRPRGLGQPVLLVDRARQVPSTSGAVRMSEPLPADWPLYSCSCRPKPARARRCAPPGR